MGSRKRKLDVDGSPGSDYEPVSESWSKTEQYKVSYYQSSIGTELRLAQVTFFLTKQFCPKFNRLKEDIDGQLTISCEGRRVQK